MNALEKLWDKIVNAFDGPSSGEKDFNQLPVTSHKKETQKLKERTAPIRPVKKKSKKGKGRKKA